MFLKFHFSGVQIYDHVINWPILRQFLSHFNDIY